MARTITKYAGDVREVYWNGNKNWEDLKNAVGDSNLACTNYLTAGDRPLALYFRDFKFNIPDDCKVTDVYWEICFSSDGDANYFTPNVYAFTSKSLSHLDPSWQSSEYFNLNGGRQPPFPSNEFVWDGHYNENGLGYGNDIKEELVNTDPFGLILRWKALKQGATPRTIRIHWVRLTVTIEEESYAIGKTSAISASEEEAMLKCIDTGMPYSVQFQLVHSGNYNGKAHDIEVKLPPSFELEYGYAVNGSFDEETRIWHCPAGMNDYLTLKWNPHFIGMHNIEFVGDKIGSFKAYYNVCFGDKTVVGDMKIVPEQLRKGELGAIAIDYTFETHLSEIEASFWKDASEPTTEFPTVPMEFDYFVVDWDNTDDGLELVNESEGGQYVRIKCKPNTVNHIRFYAYHRPHIVGTRRLGVENESVSGDKFIREYDVLEPFIYCIGFQTNNIVFSRKRFLSTTDSNMYILPVRVSPYDANIVIGKSSARVKMFRPRDYIGPIPLEQTHYSPKSDYKDKLLNENYKNKRYTGKEGASDETISLNVRLHPYDVTTVQGLVDLDKPIPFNTNHKSFEGDSLNHRGWAELYEIKGVTKTNPHWYDCDISVKYITHNINTRFSIVKGDQVSTYFLPNLLTPVFDSGSDLALFFNVETTGNYVYSSETVDWDRRNLFSIDEGQLVNIRTKNPVGLKSKFTFNWDSMSVSEQKDNRVSRILRLINQRTNQPIMEYEYFDLDFSQEGYYRGRVICRIANKGAFKTVINKRIIFHSNAEEDAEDTPTFGSKVTFELMADKLNINDEGFSGKEIHLEGLDLETGDYFFEVEFVNNNNDFDTPAIMNWFNFECSELAWTSDYTMYYNNMLVSPFPAPNHRVLFMRESEEGTIYYLEDNETEASFMLEPFYQYYTGVNLETKSGISLMNLNNSYNVVYINNGLVKLSINRMNGRMGLFKYDYNGANWTKISNLQLSNFKDINVNSFTDDKIVLQASDTIITMWRGRPFIQFNHPTENLNFLDTFTGVLSDGFNGQQFEYPHLSPLVDDTNLLPACIGDNKKLDTDCITVETVSEKGSIIKSLTVALVDDSGATVTSPSLKQEYIIKATGGVKGCMCYFIVDNHVESYNIEFDDNGYAEMRYTFDTTGEHTIQALRPPCDKYKYAFSSVLTKNVVDRGYAIKVDTPSPTYYGEVPYTCVLTQAGVPVAGKSISFTINGLTYPNKITDENGRAVLANNLDVGDYNLYVEYTEGGVVKCQDEKPITIKKNWVTITAEDEVDPVTQSIEVYKGDPFIVTFTDQLDPSETGHDNLVKGVPCVLSVNGVDYPRITDANGQAKLNINLLFGRYDLKVTIAGSVNYRPNAKNFELIVKDPTEDS